MKVSKSTLEATVKSQLASQRWNAKLKAGRKWLREHPEEAKRIKARIEAEMKVKEEKHG